MDSRGDPVFNFLSLNRENNGDFIALLIIFARRAIRNGTARDA